MNDDFNELARTINAMIDGLSPSNRFRALRAIAKKIKEKNLRRIRQNVTPLGAPMVPRAKKKLFQPQTAIKFIYPGSSGKKHAVKLTSWTLTNAVITGHDEYSGGKLKSYRRSKIIKYIPIDEPAAGITDEMRSRLHANRIKTKMFKRLGTTKYLKEKYNPDALEIAFSSGVQKVARQHHFGEMSIVDKMQNRRVRMPERPLLGIAPADEAEIMDAILTALDYS